MIQRRNFNNILFFPAVIFKMGVIKLLEHFIEILKITPWWPYFFINSLNWIQRSWKIHYLILLNQTFYSAVILMLNGLNIFILLIKKPLVNKTKWWLENNASPNICPIYFMCFDTEIKLLGCVISKMQTAQYLHL